jgi:alkaline phosphatase
MEAIAMNRIAKFMLAGVSTLAMTVPTFAQALPQAEDAYFTAAQAAVAAAAAKQRIDGPAKNVIIFVGDGMSVATVTAARILDGQLRGVDGESNSIAVDTFPYLGLAKTYSHDGQVSDSAPTATAMVSGVKTNNGVIGVNTNVQQGDCAAEAGNTVTTLFEVAEGKGLATGVVSTATITHATPAATYAHTANRNWERKADEGCLDIADQLVKWTAGGDGFEVALGGGRANFLPAETADPEDEGAMGGREDGRDLTAEWTAKSNQHAYVWNAEGLGALDMAAGTKVLGLFERSHMEYEADRANDTAGEPSLAELTSFAIERLKQDEDGFVLMVEGGRIDHAHHGGNAYRALHDTLAFDAAIKAALEATNREDTLIVVTADHSHTLTINGYPDRGNPIFDVVREGGEVSLAADGKPYTTLGYANGPGSVFPALPEGATEAEAAGPRPDLTEIDTASPDFLQQATVPLGSETHAGDDVAVYAWGPKAHLIGGTIEQNVIYHVMSNALGWDK